MKAVQVKHIRRYNRCVGLLWPEPAALTLFGLPLLAGQSLPLILITLLVGIFCGILFMAGCSKIATKNHVK